MHNPHGRFVAAGLLLLVGSSGAQAQPYEHTFGDRVLSYDEFNGVQQFVHRPTGTLIDSGAICFGSTPPTGQPFGLPDWYLVRTAVDGSPVWQRRVMVGDTSFAGATSADTLSDGSSVIAGGVSVGPSGGSFTIGVMRLTPAGVISWGRLLTGYAGNFYNDPVVAALPGDRTAVIANAFSGAYLYVLNSAGAVLVSERLTLATPGVFDLSFTDVKYDAQSDTLLISGWTTQDETFDTSGVVLRVSLTGAVLAARQFDYVNAFQDQLYFQAVAIEPVAGGAVFAVSGWHNVHEDENVFTYDGAALHAIDSSLNPTWQSFFTLLSGNQIRPHQAALRRHPDGTLGLLGQYSFGDGGGRIWLARWLLDGTFVNRHEYGYQSNSFGGGLAPALDAAGGWLLGGLVSAFSGADAYLVRTRPDATTGCDELPLEDFLQPTLVSTPVQLLVLAFDDSQVWSPTMLDMLDPHNVVCVGGVQPCNLADVTDIGDTGAGPDGQLTVDDIIAFINAFGDSTGCPGGAPCNLADVCGIGGPPEPPDGELTVDDIIAFVNAFSDGC